VKGEGSQVVVGKADIGGGYRWFGWRCSWFVMVKRYEEGVFIVVGVENSAPA
jgi:hypothetical protein